MSGLNLLICLETQKSLYDLESLSSFEIMSGMEGTLMIQLSGTLPEGVFASARFVTRLFCTGDSG
jgi:hypothetical protein